MADDRADGPGRDLVGYGRTPPRVEWPGGARLALCLVVNYEEGAEYSVPDDGRPETYGLGYEFPRDRRNLRLESDYEYGSRVGIWRLLDLFARFDAPVTVHAAATALERNPEVGAAIAELGHEPCAHGYRWEEQWTLDPAAERERIALAVASIERTCGRRPVGWYSRYGPGPTTRRHVVEEGGFLYDADAYNDDLPYEVEVAGRRHLVVPYSGVYNDGRIGATGDVEGFLALLRRAVDYHWREGEERPRMMTIGLHPRVAGHAARCSALEELLDHCRALGGVWLARREDVARTWLDQHGSAG
ncbi:MAG: polysaccharide deacetylase family protein [Thermoleophilia bacterium]